MGRIEKDAPHPNCHWSSRQIRLRQSAEAAFSRTISPTFRPIADPDAAPNRGIRSAGVAQTKMDALHVKRAVSHRWCGKVVVGVVDVSIKDAGDLNRVGHGHQVVTDRDVEVVESVPSQVHVQLRGPTVVLP